VGTAAALLDCRITALLKGDIVGNAETPQHGLPPMRHHGNAASTNHRISSLLRGVNDAMPKHRNTALPQDSMAAGPHRRVPALPGYTDVRTLQSGVAVCSFYCILS
jgi:hypothetical protein